MAVFLSHIISLSLYLHLSLSHTHTHTHTHKKKKKKKRTRARKHAVPTARALCPPPVPLRRRLGVKRVQPSKVLTLPGGNLELGVGYTGSRRLHTRLTPHLFHGCICNLHMTFRGRMTRASFTCYCGNTGPVERIPKQKSAPNLTPEQPFVLPLLQGLKPGTFWSWVRCSVPAPLWHTHLKSAWNPIKNTAA